MYNEWSLNVLYKGIDDPALQADMTRLGEVIDAYKAAVNALNADDATASLRKVVEINEEMTVLSRRLAGFFSLRRSANSADTEGAAYMTKIQAMMASTAKETVMFQKFAGKLENLDEVIAGVLHPTKGAVSVRGSIAPMIELGAGFDMELTAKEK